MTLDDLDGEARDLLAHVIAAADGGDEDAAAWLRGEGKVELVPSADDPDGFTFEYVPGSCAPPWVGWN